MNDISSIRLSDLRIPTVETRSEINLQLGRYRFVGSTCKVYYQNLDDGGGLGVLLA
jgi:hypothetical protein